MSIRDEAKCQHEFESKCVFIIVPLAGFESGSQWISREVLSFDGALSRCLLRIARMAEK